MKVVIDLFEAIPELWDECEPVEKEIFTKIIDYFKQRFDTLKEQIDNEELQNPKAQVLVRLLDESPIDKIRMIGYSNQLLDKMATCLTPQDLEYLNRLIEEIWKARNN